MRGFFSTKIGIMRCSIQVIGFSKVKLQVIWHICHKIKSNAKSRPQFTVDQIKDLPTKNCKFLLVTSFANNHFYFYRFSIEACLPGLPGHVAG